MVVKDDLWQNEAEVLEWYRSLEGIDKIAVDCWLDRGDTRLLKPLVWRIFGRFRFKRLGKKIAG